MAADTMTYENPFAYTAAGELGVNRDTMLQNELLLRVGVAVDYESDVNGYNIESNWNFFCSHHFKNQLGYRMCLPLGRPHLSLLQLLKFPAILKVVASVL